MTDNSNRKLLFKDDIRIHRLTSQSQRDQNAIRGDQDAGLRGAITSTVSIAADNIRRHCKERRQRRSEAAE